jgi:hypothetical protein
VGPAGSVPDDALERLGVDRSSLYVTNAVKHFKWKPRGKARLHKNPSAREVAACRPWLMAEIQVVRPALGSASVRPPRAHSSGPAPGSFANGGRSSRGRTGSPSWSPCTRPRSCG